MEYLGVTGLRNHVIWKSSHIHQPHVYATPWKTNSPDNLFRILWKTHSNFPPHRKHFFHLVMQNLVHFFAFPQEKASAPNVELFSLQCFHLPRFFIEKQLHQRILRELYELNCFECPKNYRLVLPKLNLWEMTFFIDLHYLPSMQHYLNSLLKGPIFNRCIGLLQLRILSS